MPDTHDKALRDHLLYLLQGEGAHASFDDVVEKFPAKLRGAKPDGQPHTPWRLLEHMRIAQWDILDFSRNPKYKTLTWPDSYWPQTDAPPAPADWDKSVKAFRDDLREMQHLVKDPNTDLYAKIPWGDGQTILREALLVADHNAYHLGELLMLRRLLGAWK
jgi:hypothetical protein